MRLRHQDQDMLIAFEKFIGNITQEMNRSKDEFHILENALQKLDYFNS
jgi:hypothetical protein